MRELKFRAWDTGAKRWTSGVMPVLTGLSLKLKPAHSGIIIEQYTGLKTRRDGKEIYEGDILQYFGATLVAEYHDEAFWAVKYDTKEAWNIRCFIGVSGARVIGNIHENPELIGAKRCQKLKK